MTFAQSPGNCLHFNGSSNNVSTALPAVFNNIPANDLTVEAWVYPEGDVFSRIVFAQQNANNFVSMSISTGNVIYFYVSNVSGQATAAGIPANQWTHVACTWDASTQQTQIFFNGVDQPLSSGGSSSTGNDNIMTIGSRTNNAQYFPGQIDEVRIWDDIRTPCEIQSAMTTEYTVAQPNLVAYYNFNQGTAGGANAGITSLPDFTGSYNGTLNGFGLTGTTSNWIASGATITSANQAPGTVNGVDTQISCSPLLWIDGNTYSSDNNTATYLLAGGSASGCDSLVTLDFTLLTPAAGTDVQASCNPLTWIDGNTYTTDETAATFTLAGSAANGCDSVVTLNFTLLTPATATDVHSTCDSFTWIDGNTYTTDESAATFTIPGGAANGCDSIVTLNLTVNSVDIGTSENNNVISANAVGATYQWLDCDNGFSAISGETNATFTPTANGNYAVAVTENSCTDTSACVAITTIGIVENFWGDDFAVYPNPTDGLVEIQFSEPQGTINLELYSLEGKRIESMTTNDLSVKMMIEQPAGVYLLELSNEIGNTTTVRIIKN